MRMTRNDYAVLYAYSFLKELRALFKDKANMWRFEYRYHLMMTRYPEKEKQVTCENCGEWLFEHFLFAVPEAFLNDRVLFYMTRPEGLPERVVAVRNGITRYEFLIEYRGSLVVRHHVAKEEE